jgi:hypothetical protein
VGKDAEWQPLLAKPLLRDATDGDNGSLDFLIKNYVERTHPFWKVRAASELTGFLCRSKSVNSALSSREDVPSSPPPPLAPHGSQGVEAGGLRE